MKTQKLKKQEKPTRTRWPIVEGIAFLAAQIGASESLIKQAKRNGSLAFLPGNRIDTGILIPELFAILTKGTDRRDFQYESTRRQRAEADKLERLNRLATGEMISIEEADQLFGVKLGAIVQRLESISSLVPGLSLAQRQVLVGMIESIKRRTKGGTRSNGGARSSLQKGLNEKANTQEMENLTQGNRQAQSRAHRADYCDARICSTAEEKARLMNSHPCVFLFFNMS